MGTQWGLCCCISKLTVECPLIWLCWSFGIWAKITFPYEAAACIGQQATKCTELFKMSRYKGPTAGGLPCLLIVLIYWMLLFSLLRRPVPYLLVPFRVENYPLVMNRGHRNEQILPYKSSYYKALPQVQSPSRKHLLNIFESMVLLQNTFFWLIQLTTLGFLYKIVMTAMEVLR